MDRRILVRRIFTIGLILVVVAAAIGVGNYFLSLRYLTVTFSNISSVDIYKTKSLNSGKADDPYKTVTTSGEELKVPKGDYTAYYNGNKGYDSKYVEFKLEEDKSIDFTASYSDTKLEEILKKELLSINRVISAKYPLVNNYDIQQGKLYKNGEWYGTTLKYKGPFTNNSDTLRIVLKKEPSGWTIITNPPDISLNKYDYPQVPVDVLKDVNTL